MATQTIAVDPASFALLCLQPANEELFSCLINVQTFRSHLTNQVSANPFNIYVQRLHLIQQTEPHTEYKTLTLWQYYIQIVRSVFWGNKPFTVPTNRTSCMLKNGFGVWLCFHHFLLLYTLMQFSWFYFHISYHESSQIILAYLKNFKQLIFGWYNDSEKLIKKMACYLMTLTPYLQGMCWPFHFG